MLRDMVPLLMFPNSRPESRRKSYPVGLPDVSTRTQADGSDVGNSPKSSTKPSTHSTHLPTAPPVRRPRKGTAWTWSFIQTSKGVPPRGSQEIGSQHKWPGGYHTMNDHLPEVLPPVSRCERLTERTVHPAGVGRAAARRPPVVAAQNGGTVPVLGAQGRPSIPSSTPRS